QAGPASGGWSCAVVSRFTTPIVAGPFHGSRLLYAAFTKIPRSLHDLYAGVPTISASRPKWSHGHGRRPLSRAGGRFLRSDHWDCVSLREPEGAQMSGLYVLGTIVVIGLAVYLVWALFRPEDFS